MREKQKLLIATTNEGKYREITHFLGDLPFQLVNLSDLVHSIHPPEETEDTFEGNALIKARYYGEKTDFLTLADDGGLCLDALGGWPGVESARLGRTKEDRIAKIMAALKTKDRTAAFRVVLTCFDPNQKIHFSAAGELRGRILEQPVAKGDTMWGYNSIFYVEELGKTYGEMTIQEKNSVSHRGQALFKIKRYLQNQYGPKHVPVPVGLIVKDGKILISLRNDPHRPEFHKKWEFPGGVMEFGEEVQENLKREIKEETGYEIEVVKQLQYIKVKWRPEWNYQVYLIPFVCRITGGDGNWSDAEILDIKYADPETVLAFDLIGDNKQMFQTLLPELKQVLAEYHL